jgi:hypothetical protein
MFLQPSQYILNAPLFHRFVCLTSRSLALLRMNLLPFDGWDLAILWESTSGNKFYALRCALTLARDENKR